MDSLFSNLTLTDIHQNIARNIVSLRVSEDLFDDLTDDPEAWQAAQLLEMETKPKLFNSHQPIIDRPFEEAEWNTAIGYPFQNSSQSRFSDGSFGVWYGADSIETTVHETAYHWQKILLDDAGFNKPGVEIERRIFMVQCDSLLIDLRPEIKSHPELLHPTDYSATQSIGRKLHREGHPGLITNSARVRHGDVYAVFTPKVLSNPAHTCFLTYRTTATGVEVERTVGEIWMTI
ncbi:MULTISPECIES: RES family NAD+ phosphorylase [Betaproteobacteria]|uniref:RES family NAD+ phosphorylase n=1 Tax=Betaproteobacteria TaxID=28216 RepID=UPI00272CBC98|nr:MULTISPECIES: RES family NAD+ phosphorylase [Betaproteobacteria]MDP3307444.1 RES family NAD+ phosphorylase [Methylotenera sp.]MDP3817946.1 RES family NAD+ phosphorylase [Methylotenera sp.]